MATKNAANISNQSSLEALSFEQAFDRLEKILDALNGGTVSLDDTLHLYEEADQLIVNCQKRLTDAERKIEVLVKNRSGDLVLGPDQKPTTQEMLNSTSE